MIYLAKWGSKTFEISPNKIVPLLSLSTSFSRKEDENNDTSGKASTNTRGMELQPISFDTQYSYSTGTDPIEEIEDWKNQFNVKAPLYINGKQFGPDLLELESVNISDAMLDNQGHFLQVTVSISLKEYIEPTTKASKKNKSSKKTSTKSGAKNAKPSKTAKKNKKTKLKRV